MNGPEPEGPSRDALRSAERLLSRRFGGQVRIGEATPIAEGRPVFRCALDSSPAGAPATVVLKQIAGRDGSAYNPADRANGGPAEGFDNERAGLAFLDSLSLAEPLSPRLLGADPRLGLLVLEDLGAGASLADALLGSDPARAEAGLVATFRSLGRLHAATAGRGQELEEVRRGLGMAGSGEGPFQRRLREHIRNFGATLDELEMEWSPPLVNDVMAVSAAMQAPGPFLAYAHGDACPDNTRLIGDGAVFFDFERGGYRHSLLDGAYARVPFPTCWCVNRLPPGLAGRLEREYQAKLAHGCPEARDEERFRRGIAEASAMWLIGTTNDLLRGVMVFDRTWGIATVRQRLLYRWEVFADLAAATHHLEALGLFASFALEKMTAKWPETQPMPRYPAFR